MQIPAEQTLCIPGLNLMEEVNIIKFTDLTKVTEVLKIEQFYWSFAAALYPHTLVTFDSIFNFQNQSMGSVVQNGWPVNRQRQLKNTCVHLSTNLHEMKNRNIAVNNPFN